MDGGYQQDASEAFIHFVAAQQFHIFTKDYIMRAKHFVIAGLLAFVCTFTWYIFPQEAKAEMPTSGYDDLVNLRIAWWGSERRHERTIKVIKLFEKQHPNIKISFEFTGWGNYWTKMEGQAIDGKLPDIMQQDYAMLKRWVNKGWIASLNQFENSETLNFKHVADSVLSTGRINGNLYGISLGTNSQAFVIDVDAFKKAGIALPEFDWTWDDFEKIAIAIHEKLGIWAIGERLISPPLLWQSYFLGHGQWSYNAEGKGLAYNDSNLTEYLDMLLRLQKAGAIPDRNKNSNIHQEPEVDVESRLVITGKAAMDYMWSNQIVAFWAAAGKERHFKIMPLPRPKKGNSSNYLKPAMFFSTTHQSKHPKEAAMFMNFFTNSLEAHEILLADRGVPISSVIRQNLQLLLSPAQFEMFIFLTQIEYNNSPTPPPNPPGHGDILGKSYYDDFINPVLFGEISPKVAAERIRDTATKALNQHLQ